MNSCWLSRTRNPDHKYDINEGAQYHRMHHVEEDPRQLRLWPDYTPEEGFLIGPLGRNMFERWYDGYCYLVAKLAHANAG